MGGFIGITKAYTILDVMGILGIGTGAMIVAFYLSFTLAQETAATPFFIILYIVTILVYFTNSGNFRLMMKTCIWRKAKVLSYKLMLYGSSLYYISYGIYDTLKPQNTSSYCTPCNKTVGYCQPTCITATDCCYDIQNELVNTLASISNFILIIAATGLVYSAEMVGFMSDYDGVSQMEKHYTIGMKSQQDQTKMLKQQIEVLNSLKVQHLNNSFMSKNDNDNIFKISQ